MPQIIVTISPQGESRVETRGFFGASCRDASEFIKQAIGKRESEVLTAEYFTTVTTHQTAQEGMR